MTNIERAIKELQDTLVVISEIERRQSALLKEHSERIVRTEELQERIEQNLTEITDKLNGLIGYVDGLPKPPTRPN